MVTVVLLGGCALGHMNFGSRRTRRIEAVGVLLSVVLGALVVALLLFKAIRDCRHRRQDRKWSVDKINFDHVDYAEDITIEQPMKDGETKHDRLEIAV